VRRLSAEGTPSTMDHSDINSSAEVAADTSSADSPDRALADSDNAAANGSGVNKRRRGSRGGQRRRGSTSESGLDSASATAAEDDAIDRHDDRNDVELPEPMREGRPSAEAAERALVRKPRIGDTMPMPTTPPPGPARPAGGGTGAGEDSDTRQAAAKQGDGRKRRRRGGSGRSGDSRSEGPDAASDAKKGRRARSGRGRNREDGQLDEATLEQRRGRERNGKPIGRYFMAVQVRPGMAQVAVLEGRSLIEHYVSRPADDVSQIHGNIYVGRIQNVLPGMEAAFVDIATPKNAVLYRGDVQYDAEDIDERGKNPRIEDILKNKQLIVCQVTKNPIAHKGARLTQEVSLPGRFVVLIPNSKTYGISKRLPDDVRKRLRGILDRVKPDEHGLIVRTAAETATEQELVADMTILLRQWDEIAAKAAKAQRPTLLYREPELAVRVIREEFNADYRGVVIDDERLFHEVKSYVAAFNPELADRIEYYDAAAEGLSVFEKHHIHEQVHKALDRKVWLPSGGSLIIEHTEALTVIDVNTGKNVGKSNLEDTVFANNMEAAQEIAKQLRLRDIGGIIVIDFIDMEIKGNRAKVVEAFRDALARDKTRSQVFDITELGLVEMTRKRIGEGLLTEYSEICPDCEGRGVVVDYSLLE
jgi:ribonuclease E